jgi:hypothetical protein
MVEGQLRHFALHIVLTEEPTGKPIREAHWRIDSLEGANRVSSLAITFVRWLRDFAKLRLILPD